MVLIIQVIVLLLFIATSNCRDLAEVSNGKFQTSATGQKTETSPIKVQSRFLGLDGIIGQLFPGFNQGQAGSATPTNPGGMGFPGNSQFYPGGTIQNTNPQLSSNPNIIDDAKLFPNQNNPGMQQYPSQGFGTLPQSQMPNERNFSDPQQMQYPSQGNFGGQAQFPGQSNGGFPNMQNPNQGNFGGTTQMQYPNQVNTGIPMQYPNQNGYGGSPSIGYPNQGSPQMGYPNQGNAFGSTQMPYPNQGSFDGMSTPMPYPNEGNFGGMSQMPYPANMNGGSPQGTSPGQGNFGGSQQQPYPGDPGQQYPTNNFGPGDGTLDSMLPGAPAYPDLPSGGSESQSPGQGQPGSNGASAILGRPVIVPPSDLNVGDQIVFPDSSDTPAQRQCVQDCQTTSEYNPVCGTNNVTYINPGKFVCARNCGVEVYVSRRGRCPADMPNPINVLPTTRPVLVN